MAVLRSASMRAPRIRLVLAGVAASLAVIALAWWMTRPRPSVDMAGFAPESAALYVELNSLPDLAEGLTESDAWARLAAPLGLSSQLDYAGPVAEMLGRFELGSDDAAVLGRSQFAIVVTSISAGADEEGDAGALVVRPRFALVVKTHSGASAAERIAADRLPQLARKAYGPDVPIAEVPGPGDRMTFAQGPAAARRMVWATKEDVVILGNDVDSVRAVLDASATRIPSLAGSFHLEKARKLVEASNSLVFAYASAATGGDLVASSLGGVTPEEAPAAGSSATSDAPPPPLGGLLSGIAKGAAVGVGYSGRFENGRFVERTATLLSPRMAEAMTATVVPAEGEPTSLPLIPAGIEEVNVVRVARPGETVESLLNSLSGSVDVAVSATLTQMAIGSRREFGAQATDLVSPMIGNEVAFLDFGNGDPFAVAFEVVDREGALPVVARYLSDGGNRSTSELYGGFEILKSTNDDGRCFAFLGRYGVYGTRDQLVKMIDARAAGARENSDLARVLAGPPPAIVGTERRDDRDAPELLLAISVAFRTSDGAVDTLERDDVKTARNALSPATSRWELRDQALVVESRSAVGNLSFLTSFLAEPSEKKS